jgi:hypothetical protein
VDDLSLHYSPLKDRNQGTGLCVHCLLTVSRACWTSDAAKLSCYDVNFESLTYTRGQTIFGELYRRMIGSWHHSDAIHPSSIATGSSRFTYQYYLGKCYFQNSGMCLWVAKFVQRFCSS